MKTLALCLICNTFAFVIVMTCMLTDASGWWALVGILFIVYPETKKTETTP